MDAERYEMRQKKLEVGRWWVRGCSWRDAGAREVLVALREVLGTGAKEVVD